MPGYKDWKADRFSFVSDSSSGNRPVDQEGTFRRLPSTSVSMDTPIRFLRTAVPTALTDWG